MEDKRELLRRIPKMDQLLEHPASRALREELGGDRCRELLREVLESLRQSILAEERFDVEKLSEAQIMRSLEGRAAAQRLTALTPLLNGTGILLHTNLGRAPLGDRVAQQAAKAASGYSNLEYCLEEGRRGSRHDIVAEQLCRLTGAEDAMVVNNNAAAVLLILAALARGKEVVVSRGELVEIGGAFRVPEVMTEGGAILREVGTTNKTRISDYRKAVQENTAAFLKVHASNFRIQGFTEEASLEELKELSLETGLPLIYDLGSGLLHPDPPAELRHEPRVREAILAGCDLVSFSGDKLLGGPQAGIIAGRKDLITLLKRHQLARALRVDKLCLAALQELLEIYSDPRRINMEIPIFAMLSESRESLEKKADLLCDRLDQAGIEAHPVATFGEIGGGSAPGVSFPSIGIAIKSSSGLSLDQLERRLRLGDPPVIAYIRDEELILDLRCLKDRDLESLARVIARAFEGEH